MLFADILMAAATQASGGAIGTTAAVFNPSDKSSTITLSNGNLTATSSATGFSSAGGLISFSSSSMATGRSWFMHVDTNGNTFTGMGLIGVGDAGSSFPSSSSVAYLASGDIYYNNSDHTGFTPTFATGDVVGCHMFNDTVWFTVNGTSITGVPFSSGGVGITPNTYRPLMICGGSGQVLTSVQAIVPSGGVMWGA